jgi:uncharacterized membrane protein (UPF0127 family)
MNKYVGVSGGVALLGCAVLGVLYVKATKDVLREGPQKNTNGIPAEKEASIRFGTTTVVVEIADTALEMTRGLSGRESLPEGRGMLFVMSSTARHSFWMPDMRFAIDIVWFDDNMRVVDVTENATPESYPMIFRPDEPARYALEVPAGYARARGIVQGTQGILQKE